MISQYREQPHTAIDWRPSARNRRLTKLPYVYGIIERDTPTWRKR